MCAAMGMWYGMTTGLGEPKAETAALIFSLKIDLSEYWSVKFAYALAVTAVAGMLKGFSGFGETLVMVPLLTFVYGPAESVALGIGLSALGSILLLPEASRDADWPDVWPACLLGFIFVPIGV